MKLELKHVACGYGHKQVLHNISLSLDSGEILCLLGPNGVGKTTLFKSILGFLPLQDGQVLLNEKDVRLFTQRKRAKVIGYVPQAHEPPFPFKVIDVVMMGRTAQMGRFRMPSRQDGKAAQEALESIGAGFLKGEIYTEISGGERQMVLIARALAQNPQILVMDEPTSNLDFGNQMRVLEQIKKLAARGLGIIMTTHFPDHAFLCSNKVAMLSKNNVIMIGTADDVISEENLKSAYGVNVKITTTMGERDNCIKSCVPLLGA